MRSRSGMKAFAISIFMRPGHSHPRRTEALAIPGQSCEARSGARGRSIEDAGRSEPDLTRVPVSHVRKGDGAFCYGGLPDQILA